MSLDSLRKLREQRVEALMMELAKIAQSLSRNETRSREVEAEMQVDTERYRQHMQQGLTIEGLLEWQARLGSHEATLRQVHRDIEHAALLWNRTNSLLVEASQECKVLDRVLERREAIHRADVVRREQQTMDEAASRRCSPR
ncbi:MAG: flagellar FliJ family protein [Nitrospira sp.]|nr:flagellar FliJ family protein [Nitrospira sp.]